ncbi:Sec61-gamma subunit of protein translocation complex, putative [Plasmodium berghei]|uniref:Sec61-gamma subunit of protein translocation complex n=6 Tax=Plasmodium (Vinckeia) TaxID=418101 RepID=A0AAF0B2R4_PLAYO|nr:Sec61-gamma subunit of protein translocation complex, putative [Plasmodium berghei ANKA]XP_728579.1 protein translocase SEC61 complex subunit gamma [Plasmodium yoelii]EAA20144.1 protein translocase SEC61 complex gamma subunit, archaeal and eukaryotic, putative [Plasmodium yoelii yoelii]ETB57116.1 protein translocase SEC61 complex gamma subunit, archaeal and eukaryotic [Plasmodium yoelii 17X]CXH94026.1 Sec61-gamma subunit of protein translocation complex, putative [Plasmodium berghei]WBY5499|eukprot:XP_034419953.1 Sec61-gamma subunit of protein translocation complex, putative [Plasmodium berghei ANKA]
MLNNVKIPEFVTDEEHPIGYIVTSIHDFVNDSVRLVRKCTKPSKKEYTNIVCACTIGFLIMGLIGYTIKLVFIPINNIFVGSY